MMGTFRVRAQVFSLKDPERRRDLEMLVDTGATQSMVPRTPLEAHSVPVEREQTFLLANGGEIHRDVGWVGVRVDDRHAYTLAVFGAAADATVLGALTLEELGLEVDPRHRTLKPTIGWLLAA